MPNRAACRRPRRLRSARRTGQAPRDAARIRRVELRERLRRPDRSRPVHRRPARSASTPADALQARPIRSRRREKLSPGLALPTWTRFSGNGRRRRDDRDPLRGPLGDRRRRTGPFGAPPFGAKTVIPAEPEAYTFCTCASYVTPLRAGYGDGCEARSPRRSHRTRARARARRRRRRRCGRRHRTRAQPGSAARRRRSPVAASRRSARIEARDAPAGRRSRTRRRRRWSRRRPSSWSRASRFRRSPSRRAPSDTSVVVRRDRLRRELIRRPRAPA